MRPGSVIPFIGNPRDFDDSHPTVVAILDPPDTPNSGVAHLVLKSYWPIALCGFNVSTILGTQAPAMDRCPDCLRIASERRLGRPGWNP